MYEVRIEEGFQNLHYLNDLKINFMIIVHDIFICKPGQASKMAKMFKSAMAEIGETVEVMTDMTGQFNKVVMVSKYENLAAYEVSFDKFMKDPEMMKKMGESMAGYHEMFYTGSREIYKQW